MKISKGDTRYYEGVTDALIILHYDRQEDAIRLIFQNMGEKEIVQLAKNSQDESSLEMLEFYGYGESVKEI